MVNERSKLAIKVALALTLAVVCALWLGWEKPYWAGFSVAVMAVTETTGHSLRKGKQRLLGTVIGVICAFLFVAIFAQQPLAFLLCFTAFNGFCVYMQGNMRSGYIWSICLMVCVLIIAMGKLSGELTFAIGMLRLQETILGIACFTIVFSLLWPISSRHLLQKILLDFFVSQQSKSTKTAAALTARGERTQGLGFGDGIKFLSRIEELLPAAIIDSYHVANKAQSWKHFVSQMHEWALLCGLLSEASELLGKTTAIEDHSEIKELLLRVKQRFANAEKLLREKTFANNPLPKKITLCVNATDDPQRHGAILLLESVLNSLDALNHSMLATLHSAFTDDAPKIAPLTKKSSTMFFLDHERLCTAIKSYITTWIFIVLWLYVPFTGGSMIVMLGVIFGSNVFTLPFCNAKTLLCYMVSWSIIILLQYILLMPYLSELWQLAGFYFINSFAIWYKLTQPQQALSRLLGTIFLTMMTMNALKMQPEYTILFPLLELFLIVVAMLVAYFINLSMFSNQPQCVFLRHLKLLRHLFSWQLRSLSQGDKKQYCLSSYLGQYLLGKTPLHSVMLTEQAMIKINWSAYPEVDKELTGKIIARLYATNLRVLSLQDSYISYMQETENTSMAGLLEKTITALSSMLNRTSSIEQLQPVELKLNQLQQHIKEYLTEVNTNSILQGALTQRQALYAYRALAAVKLLIEEFRKISILLPQANLKELKYNYFSL